MITAAQAKALARSTEKNQFDVFYHQTLDYAYSIISQEAGKGRYQAIIPIVRPKNDDTPLLVWNIEPDSLTKQVISDETLLGPVLQHVADTLTKNGFFTTTTSYSLIVDWSATVPVDEKPVPQLTVWDKVKTYFE